tara:strand:- start:3787 stop:5211 length:1425 start_codon:yes stop_codon:yes gene_type:complete
MAIIIEQKPLFDTVPVGQEIIFAVSNTSVINALLSYFNIKFIANVFISDTSINFSSAELVGTFKTTPNRAGVGIFDFRPIIESFVSADNIAGDGSPYKIFTTNDNNQFPVHIINKFSTNNNSLRYLAIKFEIEASTTQGGNPEIIAGQEQSTDEFTLFNGYLKYNDQLQKGFPANFGYDTTKFELKPVSLGQFLSNAPATQYANKEDYGTISVMTTPTGGSLTALSYVKFTYFQYSGASPSENISNTDANGGFTTYTSDSKNQMLHIGCFPANLRNYSTLFNNLINLEDISHYTVQAFNSANTIISETTTIYVNCPTLKGYKPIRLCWLNQWGTWDYYTFKMKSTKTIKTKGSTYTQLGGTWNKELYIGSGFKGGKKAFRVNATEKIQMNTDFVNESESEWFEELINSPEVYIVNNYISESFPVIPLTIINPNIYINPVRLTTSSYTTKTVANDKIMQYTFEVEKSKTLRTQAV